MYPPFVWDTNIRIRYMEVIDSFTKHSLVESSTELPQFDKHGLQKYSPASAPKKKYSGHPRGQGIKNSKSEEEAKVAQKYTSSFSKHFTTTLFTTTIYILLGSNQPLANKSVI